jgi:TPR repeat protein
MNSRQHHSRSYFQLSIFLFAALLILPCPSGARAQTTQISGAQREALRARAESGESGAQYQFAKYVLEHNPSAEEVQSALKWLRASAAQQNPKAAFYLGYLYEHGKYVPQDYRLALQSYELAARVQYSPAENNLASLYEHGQGVPKDMNKAFEWYLASAKHGDPVGQINLATFYYVGLTTPSDSKEAVRWLQRSADSGLPEAQNNLAYFYFFGIGTRRDEAEAGRLVRLAAQTGLPGAETNLGFLYESGKGVPLDYVAAYSWYSRAIADGDSASAERRKALSRIMTHKQLDEANSLATVSARPAPPTSLAPSLNAFSLVGHH